LQDAAEAYAEDMLEAGETISIDGLAVRTFDGPVVTVIL